MTQVAANIPSVLKRVARVSVIAAFTASTLAMLGMTSAQVAGRKAVKAVKPAAAVVVAPVVHVAAPQADWDELMKDESAVQAAAFMPAVVPLPHHRTVRMEVTAYCPCPICCGEGAHGITASGKLVSHNGGRFVAA